MRGHRRLHHRIIHFRITLIWAELHNKISSSGNEADLIFKKMELYLSHYFQLLLDQTDFMNYSSLVDKVSRAIWAEDFSTFPDLFEPAVAGLQLGASVTIS